jgi:hypothetical protein
VCVTTELTMRVAPLLLFIASTSGGWKTLGFVTRKASSGVCHVRKISYLQLGLPNDSNIVNAHGNDVPGVAKLQPYLPAADPRWACIEPIGIDGFVISREGEPTQIELANENILKIVKNACTDLEVNTLVWKCLGYRFNTEIEEWSASECFPKWREKHPTPPDLIGMQRMYVKQRCYAVS